MTKNEEQPSAAVLGSVSMPLSVPHLDQYFGVWAIHEETFRAAVARIGTMDLRLHVAETQAEIRGGDRKLDWAYPIEGDGVAVIALTGPLMKYVSSLSGGTSTVFVRRVLRQAVADDRVRSLVLRIDSPGGTVSGTADLAADVARANKRKPVLAYIEDIGASAAYWIASQARRVYAGATAMVGSIGIYSAIHDLSGYAAKEGIKVHVLRAGAFKGAGEPGTEITPEQLAEWQRIVDELNEFFVRAVAAGRRMGIQRVRELADGRLHVGGGAETLGLIDGVRTFDETFAELTGSKAGVLRNKSRTEEIKVMDPNAGTVNVEAAAVATNGASALEELAGTGAEAKSKNVETQKGKQAVPSIAELKAAFPDSDATFREACQEAEMTLAQATTAWMARLREQNAALAKQVEDANAKTARPGVNAVGGAAAGKSAGEDVGSATEQWTAAVAEKVKNGIAKPRAISAVDKENPELRRAYLEEYNAKYGRLVEL